MKITSTIKVTVKTKDVLIYNGNVHAITSYNDKGIFDVLPLHENFISLINEKIILYGEAETKELKVEGGIIKVKDNQVHIYLGLPATSKSPIIQEKKGVFSRLKEKLNAKRSKEEKDNNPNQKPTAPAT